MAVLETATNGGELSLSERQYMTNVFREQAVKILPAEQNFTIMTRENINAMLPPGKSVEDCEGSCLTETGRNIAADYVAQARVGRFGETLTLTAELYETATNKLVASFNGRGDNAEKLLEVIKGQAPNFFKKVKGEGFLGVSGIGNISSGGAFEFAGNQKFIVNIETAPAGAIPTIDGKAIPKCTSTPCKVQVEAGEHRVVVSKDRYDDSEMVVNVSANDQVISITMAPAFGFLDLNPKMELGVGNPNELKYFLNETQVSSSHVELDPGIYDVLITHPCYDPVNFKVAIEKGHTESYDGALTRGVSGLELDAEWEGNPQIVPVFIDDVSVGSTPYSGTVPLCAEVTVGENAREKVLVDLKWHEVVKFTHRIKQRPATVAMMEPVPMAVAPAPGVTSQEDAFSFNEDDFSWSPQTAKTSDKINPVSTSNTVSPSGKKRSWGILGLSSAVAVSGVVLAIVGNNMAKSAADKGFSSEGEYNSNLDKAKKGQNLRAIGIVVGVVGVVGIGVSFVF